MTDFDKFKKALMSKGLSEIEAEVEANKLVKKGIKFEDIIEDFITRADNDPSSINDCNCLDGKCSAKEITWKK